MRLSWAMMEHDYDSDYYTRREAACRKLATQATDQTVARVHREMADNYAKLARTAQRAKLRVVPE